MKRMFAIAAAGSAWPRRSQPALPLAQQKIVLKATDVHPLGYPTVEAVVRMGKKLEEATNGRLSIQMYPVDAARRREGNDRAGAGRRAADRAHQPRPDGTAGAGAQRLQPAVRVPRPRAHDTRSSTGPIGDEMLKKLTDHPNSNLIGLAWMTGGTRNVYSKKPVKSAWTTSRVRRSA